jgi:hypothetical protein
MNEMDWMTVEQTFEEELAVERQCRSVNESKDFKEIQFLCIALIRQNWHQRKLLCQAVNRISEMDAQEACSD